MTDKIASLISWIIDDFLSPIYNDQYKKQLTELSKQCIDIGYSMAYDSFIHLRKIDVGIQGLGILKHIYRKAKKNKMRHVLREIDEQYLRLKTTLQRPERDDLNDAQEIVKIFYRELNVDDFGLPEFPDHIMRRLKHERGY